MASLSAVCDAIGNNIIGYMQASGVGSGLIYKGWPTFEDTMKALQATQCQISIYPLPAMRDTTRFYPRWMGSRPVAALTGSVNGLQITFLDNPVAGTNVHTIIGNPTSLNASDAYYQVQTGDTLNSVATNVAAAITALGVAGVTASSSNNVVTVVGASVIKCNVGTSTTLYREVRRMLRNIQVSVWVNSGDLRNNVEDVITSNIGTGTRQFIPLPDGTNVWMRLHSGPIWDDLHQLDSSLYIAHIIYQCEYPTLEASVFTQIGGTKTSVTVAEPGLTEIQLPPTGP